MDINTQGWLAVIIFVSNFWDIFKSGTLKLTLAESEENAYVGCDWHPLHQQKIGEHFYGQLALRWIRINVQSGQCHQKPFRPILFYSQSSTNDKIDHSIVESSLKTGNVSVLPNKCIWLSFQL